MSGPRRTLRERMAPAQDRDRRVLERAAAMLRAWQRNGLTMIAIEDVLLMLGTDPEPVPRRQAEPQPEPGADPLTGCLPVTPPGTGTPG